MSGSAPRRELRGRRSECEALDRLVAGAKADQSQVLVLRGEAGVGKSALVEYLVGRAAGCQVLRAAGVDIPGMVVAAGVAAGLELVEECIALICGVRNGVIIPRASFFQQKNVRDAIAAGEPQWLLQHEDVLVLTQCQSSDSRNSSDVGL